MSSQLDAPAALLPGDEAPGAHRTAAWVIPRDDPEVLENRKFLAHVAISTSPVRPARGVVTIPTELPRRLRYHKLYRVLCQSWFVHTATTVLWSANDVCTVLQ
jgi:hypothetical protein